jgi:hypothetical protein
LQDDAPSEAFGDVDRAQDDVVGTDGTPPLSGHVVVGHDTEARTLGRSVRPTST